MQRRMKTLIMLMASIIALGGCYLSPRPSVRDARSAGGLAYDIEGQGPLVVLIHGSNLDRRMWVDDSAWLRRHARVLTYDQRGQGGSDDPVQAFSNHGDLIVLLNELGEGEASLIGLSSGAQVALDVALVAPGRVKKLVLVSPSLSGYVPKEMPNFFGELGAALREQDFDRANEVLLASSIMSVPPAYSELVRTMVTDNTRLWSIPYSLVEQATPPAIERLDSIALPVLILSGGNDLEAIRDQGRLLEQRLANARRLTVTGGGHLLNMTSPNKFRDALSSFLGLTGD